MDLLFYHTLLYFSLFFHKILFFFFFHFFKFRNKRPSSARRSRGEGNEEKSKEFNKFLARQNARSARREKNLESLRKRATPSHKPRICSKSRSIAKNTAQGRNK